LYIFCFFYCIFYFFFCESAEPAADFDVVLVLPSRSTLDAAVAAFLLVVSVRVFDWVNALPAADFDAFPVDFDESVFAAALAAFGLVCLDFAISFSPSHVVTL